MISRRRWMAGASGTAAMGVGLLGCRRPAAPPPRTGLIAGSKTITVEGRQQHAVLVADAHGRVLRDIAIDFQMHGFTWDPLAPGRVVVFEKKGAGCCEVDLVRGTRLRTIPTVPGRRFYGHGVFSADGRLLFATETVLDGKSGLISIRDAQTFAVQGEFPTYGLEPHDCQLVEGGRILAITNGGSAAGETRGATSAPCVTYVDIASERLVETLRFENERINAGHLAVTSTGFLVAVSAPRTGLPATEPGAITLRPKGGPFRTMTEPGHVVRRMTGETLSLAVHEPSGIVAATNPDGNLVTFWNLERGTLAGTLELAGARGIALTQDGSHFLISWGPGANLAFLPTHSLPEGSLQIDTTQGVPKAGFSGSHLFNWNHDSLLRAL